MSEIASQITSLTIVYSIVYSDADQRKHQSSASLASVRGIHRGPVNSPHKWPVTRKIFPFDDVIMISWCYIIGRPDNMSMTCTRLQHKSSHAINHRYILRLSKWQLTVLPMTDISLKYNISVLAILWCHLVADEGCRSDSQSVYVRGNLVQGVERPRVPACRNPATEDIYSCRFYQSFITHLMGGDTHLHSRGALTSICVGGGGVGVQFTCSVFTFLCCILI